MSGKSRALYSDFFLESGKSRAFFRFSAVPILKSDKSRAFFLIFGGFYFEVGQKSGILFRFYPGLGQKSGIFQMFSGSYCEVGQTSGIF